MELTTTREALIEDLKPLRRIVEARGTGERHDFARLETRDNGTTVWEAGNGETVVRFTSEGHKVEAAGIGAVPIAKLLEIAEHTPKNGGIRIATGEHEDEAGASAKKEIHNDIRINASGSGSWKGGIYTLHGRSEGEVASMTYDGADAWGTIPAMTLRSALRACARAATATQEPSGSRYYHDGVLLERDGNTLRATGTDLTDIARVEANNVEWKRDLHEADVKGVLLSLRAVNDILATLPADETPIDLSTSWTGGETAYAKIWVAQPGRVAAAATVALSFAPCAAFMSKLDQAQRLGIWTLDTTELAQVTALALVGGRDTIVTIVSEEEGALRVYEDTFDGLSISMDSKTHEGELDRRTMKARRLRDIAQCVPGEQIRIESYASPTALLRARAAVNDPNGDGCVVTWIAGTTRVNT